MIAVGEIVNNDGRGGAPRILAMILAPLKKAGLSGSALFGRGAHLGVKEDSQCLGVIPLLH